MLLKGIGYSSFKHRDIEHRINSPYGVWKIKCKGLWTGLNNYLI